MPGNENNAPQTLGPYQLVRLIATGGMAQVYQARRDGPHGFTKTVAVKRILPQLARDEDFVEMFIDEARVCAQLSHPNLVQVFDFGEADGELYMAMEYVEGTNCAKAVRQAASRREMVPIDIVVYVILSVLRGLEYAHDALDIDGVPLGLVHRDVSPGNILLARSGAVKLGDFGIARADDFKSRTQEGQLKGKLGYMSPEQVTGQPLDARSDLFTLGIVMAELLMARPLFGTQNELDVLLRIRDANISSFERHSDHLPAPIIDITQQALARNPDDRFQSARAFAEALEEFARVSKLGVGSSHMSSWLTRLQLVSPHVSGELAANPGGRRRSSDLRRRVSSGSINRYRSSSSQPLTQRHSPEDSSAKDPEEQSPVSQPAKYKLIIKDDTVGPVSYAEVVEVFALGQAKADTLVSRVPGPFRPARELPELARMLAAQALNEQHVNSSSRSEHWNIDLATHAQKLFEIFQRKQTGVLIAEDGDRQKKLFFLDGEPTYTSSNEKNELLGQQLIAQGIVLPLEVDMALALCPRYGGRLGDALVGIEVLRPVELVRALTEQVRNRFEDLLSWRRGTMTFVHDVRIDDSTVIHDIAMPSVISRGVRHAYREEELERLLAPFEQEQIRSAPVPGFSVNQLRLPRPMHDILLSIEKARSLGEIEQAAKQELHASKSDVLFALFIGLSSRLLVATGWPPRSEMPSVPTKVM